jgi:uncharacterized protein (TIGR00645 family)
MGGGRVSFEEHAVNDSDQSVRVPPIAERTLEFGLFNARWLMAPFYIGLVIALASLLVVFVNDLLHELPHVLTMKAEDGILMALSLIDLSLAGNLLLIVIFSGYENFVSKIDTGSHDRPSWMGTVDFQGLKMKLIASIVAISAIALLRAFMQLAEEGPLETVKLSWMVGIHLTFCASGVLMAITDWLGSKSAGH